MSDTNPKTIAATPIRIDEVYTLAEFQRRTGLKRNGMRTARRHGLPVRQCGRNRYVVGAEWVEFLQTAGKVSPGDR